MLVRIMYAQGDILLSVLDQLIINIKAILQKSFFNHIYILKTTVGYTTNTFLSRNSPHFIHYRMFLDHNCEKL